MKKFFLVPLVIACGVLSAAAQEPAAAAKTPTEELLEVMRYDQMSIESALASFDGMAEQFKKQGLPPEAINEIRAAAKEMYLAVFGSPEVRKMFVTLYDKYFTSEEIKQLTEFYRTPLGRKSLAAVPAISADAMKVAMPAIQKETPAFQKKVSEIMAKYKPATPAAPKK